MSGYQKIIVPVVEGHGEVDAVPALLRHYFKSFGHYQFAPVDQAVRASGCGALKCAYNPAKKVGVEYYVGVALARNPAGILVMIDADEECLQRAKVQGRQGLGPELLARAQAVAWRKGQPVPVSVVVADREFEAWFLAAWEHYLQRGDFKNGLPAGYGFTTVRDCKGAVGKLMNTDYSPTVHQRNLAAVLPSDWKTCRGMCKRAPSFRKFVREFKRLVK